MFLQLQRSASIHMLTSTITAGPGPAGAAPGYQRLGRTGSKASQRQGVNSAADVCLYEHLWAPARQS